MKCLPLLWLVLLAQNGADPATDPPEAADPPPQVPAALIEQAKSLGPWENHAEMETAALESVFNRNGWDSEPDRFAFDLVTRVNRIPPWEQQERMNAFLGGIQERLDLNPDQRRLVSRKMQYESMRIGMNHLTEVLPIATEAIQARASGQPYTAEQVARWSKVFRPIAEEGREAIERVSRDLAKTMTPEQRDKLRADVNALLRRHKGVISQMREWEEGGWTPEAWGLENDPIQQGQGLDGAARVSAAAAAVSDDVEGSRRGQQTPATDAAANFETEWARYVREFGQRHEFTPAQRESGAAILKDMETRARRWRDANTARLTDLRERIKSGGRGAAATSAGEDLKKLNKPIDDMFEELKGRLRSLLTSEQRSRTGID